MRRMAEQAPNVPIDVRVQQAANIHEEILAQLEATVADLLVSAPTGGQVFSGSSWDRSPRKSFARHAARR